MEVPMAVFTWWVNFLAYLLLLSKILRCLLTYSYGQRPVTTSTRDVPQSEKHKKSIAASRTTESAMPVPFLLIKAYFNHTLLHYRPPRPPVVPWTLQRHPSNHCSTDGLTRDPGKLHVLRLQWQLDLHPDWWWVVALVSSAQINCSKQILFTNYSKFYLFLLSEMHASNVYAANRGLPDIRVIDTRTRRITNELQVFLPNKFSRTERMTPKQMMNMIQAIMTKLSCTIPNADVVRLKAQMATLQPGNIPDGLNGGFSTDSYHHLKLPIEQREISPNGLHPNTIPAISRPTIWVTPVVAEAQVGSSAGQGVVGRSDVQHLLKEVNSSATKAQPSAAKKSKFNKPESKLTQQNRDIRSGRHSFDPKSFNILVIAGPSLPITGRAGESPPMYTLGARTLPYKLVAKMVGFNPEMMGALGDVLELSRQSMEHMIDNHLGSAKRLAEDINQRLYYQYIELNVGGHIAQEINIGYITADEDRTISQANFDLISNLLSSHSHGDKHTYNKGLKGIIRRPNTKKEKRSDETKSAQKELKGTTVSAPFVLTIKAITGMATTLDFLMQRVLFMFNNSSLTTKHIEHIGPITQNDGIYLAFTDIETATIAHAIFSVRADSMYEIFSFRYTVTKSFRGTGGGDIPHIRNSYPSFFLPHVGLIPPPNVQAAVNVQAASHTGAQSYRDATNSAFSSSSEQVQSQSSTAQAATQANPVMDATPTRTASPKRKIMTDYLIDRSGKKPSASVASTQESTNFGTQQTEEPSMLFENDIDLDMELSTKSVNALPYMERLASSDGWLQLTGSTFQRIDTNITIHQDDHMNISIPYQINNELVHAFSNDCVPVSMAYLIRQTHGYSDATTGKLQPLNYEDIGLLLQYERTHADRLHAEQKQLFNTNLERFTTCIANQLFGKTIEPPSLNECITGDIVIQLLDISFILIHQPNNTGKLVALRPDTKLHTLLDDTPANRYLLIITDNHLDVVPFAPHRATLRSMFPTDRQEASSITLPVIPGLLQLLSTRHFGSLDQKDSDLPSGDGPTSSPAMIQPLSPDSSPTATESTRKRTRIERFPEEPTDSAAGVAAVASTVTDNEDRSRLSAYLSTLPEWRHIDAHFFHVQGQFKLHLSSQLPAQEIRLTMTHLDLLPERCTVPNDCGIWHLCQYYKFQCGMTAEMWSPDSLTNADMCDIYQHTQNFPNLLTPLEHQQFKTILLRYLVSLMPCELDIEPLMPPLPLHDAMTMQLILHIARPNFILYEIAPHQYEVLQLRGDLKLFDLINPTIEHPSHVFLFQNNHVRLVSWKKYRYILHNALSKPTIHSSELFLPSVYSRGIPMQQFVGSTSPTNHFDPSDTHNPEQITTTSISAADFSSTASTSLSDNAVTNSHQLFSIFQPAALAATAGANLMSNAFTAAQWARLQQEREVGREGSPALYVTAPSTVPIATATAVSSNSRLTRQTSSGAKRTRSLADNAHLLDAETIAWYRRFPRGCNLFRIYNAKRIGSGLELIGVLRITDGIPCCGKIRLNCTIAQLRRVGGVIELPRGAGYLIESYPWDVGYGTSARNKLPCAANFARLVTLVAMNDPRINLKMDHTAGGHPVLRPTRHLRGTPTRPISLYLGHAGIPLLREPIASTLPLPPPRGVKRPSSSPFFRPTGRRRDPSNRLPVELPLPAEEQPSQYEMPDDLDITETDIESAFGATLADCNTSCVNVKGNGLTKSLLTKLVTLKRRRKLDVLALIDVGFTDINAARIVFKQFFGSANIYIIPAKPPRNSDRHHSRATGGMVIITDEKRVKIQRHFADPSGLGIHHTIRVAIRHKITDLMFVYWPSPAAQETVETQGRGDSMLSKLTDFLQLTDNQLTPDDWLKSQIRNRCPTLLQQSERHFVLMGDFNRTFNSADLDAENTLAQFVTSLGLTTILKNMLDERGKGCNSFFRGSQATEIDHIFTTIPAHLITNGGRGDPTYWCDDGDTDHVPCWIGFLLLHDQPSQMPPEQNLVMSAMSTLAGDTANTRSLVTEVLLQWWENHPQNPEVQPPTVAPSAEIAGNITEALSRGMAAEVIQALGRKARPYKNGGIRYSRLWSPKASALSQHHVTMNYLVRTLNSPKSIGTKLRLCRRKIERWEQFIQWRRNSASTRYDYRPDLEGCNTVTEWLSFLDQAQAIEHASFDERTANCDNLKRLAQVDQRNLGRKLHVRKRRQYLQEMGRAVQSRENRLIDKQLKRAFSSLTEKQQGAYNFTELTLPDGTVTTDPEKMHDEVTKFFYNIFDNPSNALPTRCDLELPNFESLPKWERMLEDKEFFCEVYSGMGIPEDVVATLADAFSQPERCSVAQDIIERALAEPFHFEDFVRIIKRSRGQSSGGITGLNYGILKLAPESLLQYLFDLCTTMWDQKYIPPYWKVKYLHLLVKDMSQSGLNNLRPIGLIEVLRKIWSNLIIHRIRLALAECDFLASTQYGFVYRKGTTDELIQLTNVLEAAAEGRHDIELTTWDITKAFDSVGRTLQLITWLRMGVPKEIALWFVNLDQGGSFIVKSPWALHHMSSLTIHSAPTEITTQAATLGFQAKRGFTQGDVLSTTGWVGFFDILLRALQSVPDCGKFCYRGEGIQLHQQDAMAYADDLVTVASTRAQTNAFSRIICGFMALFGLKLAPNKIRSTTTLQQPGVLTYYDWNWTEQTRPFGTSDTSIKILGVLLSANGQWDAQFADLLLHCQKIAQTVGRKMASLTLKTTVLLSSTLAQVLYRTQVIALRDTELDKLTKLLMGVLRDYHTIGRTYPTLALTSKILSGIFVDVRTATAKRKWNIMGRMTAIGGAQTDGMQSLLGRLHRIGYRDGSPNGQTASIRHPKPGALPRWADNLPTSLLPEHVLRYFGHHPNSLPPLIHDLLPQIDVPSAELLEELDIQYLPELMPDGQELPAWLNENTLPTLQDGVRALRNSATIANARNLPAFLPECPITPGQFYTFEGPEYRKLFFEVDGQRANGDIAGRWWTKHGTSNSLRPSGNHGCRGAAHADSWNPHLLPYHTSRRAILHRPGGNTDAPRLLGILPVTAIPPRAAVDDPAPWCTRLLADNLFDPADITFCVSDASYKRSQVNLHSIFSLAEAPPTHACGAFVLLSGIRPVLGIQLTGMEELDHYDNFVGELYAGVAMAQLRACLPNPVQARMDCKSVLDAANDTLPIASEFYGNLQEDYGPLLQQFGRLRRGTNQPPVTWTRGHPDQDIRRKDGTTRPAIPRREWGPQEYGIYVADHLSDLNPNASSTLLNEGLMPQHVIEVHITEIIRSIPMSGQWFRCLRAQPDIPIFRPSTYLLDEAHFQRYCYERERASRRDNRWSSVQLGMLKPSLKMLHAHNWASNWAKYMRIILDKLPHGRNIAKGQGEDAPIPPCPLCHEGEDSLEHIIICRSPEILSSRTEHFRALDDRLHTFCVSNALPDDALRLSRAYLFSCVSQSLPPIDILGGWTGIPVPRFLSFFSPNIPISEEVAKGLCLTIPRVIADCLDWLHYIWRKRCSLVHGRSDTQSQTAASGTSTNPEASTSDTVSSSQREVFQSRRWAQRGQRPSQPTSPPTSNSQQSITSFLSPGVFDFPSVSPLIIPGAPPATAAQGSMDLIDMEHSSMADMENTLLHPTTVAPANEARVNTEPLIRPVTRSTKNLFEWHFRNRLNALDMVLSTEWAPSLAPSCAHLSGHFTSVPRSNHYFLPFPYQGFMGNSRIAGAGRALFVDTSNAPSVLQGSVMGEYFGPSTANGGIDAIYLVRDEDPPGRDNGAYLLQNQQHYIVDAHPDCAMGYLNDPFEPANCFFQAHPDNPCQILVISRVVFPSRGVYELTVNYGWDYWADRLHLLSPDAAARCVAFYHPEWTLPGRAS